LLDCLGLLTRAASVGTSLHCGLYANGATCAPSNAGAWETTRTDAQHKRARGSSRSTASPVLRQG
jgi:hypothetical protein